MDIFLLEIKCGSCGSWYGSKVWHSNSKYRRTVWQCNHKFKGQQKCSTPHFDEDTIKELFVKAANKLMEDKNEIIANFELIKSVVFDTAGLEKEQAQLQNELEVVSGMIQQAISENAHYALDQKEYQEYYNGLVDRFNLAKARHTAVSEEITDKKTRLSTINAFLCTLLKQDNLLTKFDEKLWCSHLDYATVYDKDNVCFTFKDGTEIQA